MLIEYKPFPQGVLSELTGKFTDMGGGYFYALHNGGEVNSICFAHFCEWEKCENILKFYRFHEWDSTKKPYEVTRLELREIAMIFVEPNIIQR